MNRISVAFWLMTIAAGTSASAQSGKARTPGAGQSLLGQPRPLAWIENRGQWSCDAHFVARLPDLLVRAEPGALGLQVFDHGGDRRGGVYMRLAFEGASPAATLIPERPGSALHSWFIGNDPTQWHTGLREHGALRWHGLYEGVDLILHEDDGAVKYDLELAPGADLSQVRIRCEGVERVEVDAQGLLVISGERGCFTQARAASFEATTDGRLEPIDVRYRVIDAHTFGFAANGRDPRAALWIDPTLDWSTYFGGPPGPLGGLEYATGVDLDVAGDVYIAGEMQSLSFPTTPGTYQSPSANGNDCFAAKFDGSTGSLIYSSVFGGVHVQERPESIRADAQGRAVVAGWTDSFDFPSTPGAYDPVGSSVGAVGFVLQLSRSGDTLLWSTFLKGTAYARITDLALSATGAPIVVGSTATDGFPTTSGAWDTTWGGHIDGFVTKFDPTGSFLEWSTFLGGLNADYPEAVEVDAAGFVTIAGETNSPNFPTTPGVYSPTYLGGIGQLNIFVTRINPQGTSLVWSTFLGGTQTDFVRGLALVPDGGVVITGSTFSHDFPVTPGTIGALYSGSYAARLDRDGARLIYSTYLGVPGVLTAIDVAVDRSGIATIAGHSFEGPALTPGAFDLTPNGNEDVILMRISPSASKLYYATYLGGAGEDRPEAIVTTAADRLTVVGITGSPNYPTTPGAFATTGGGDCFVTTFRPHLQGVEPYGTSTDSCHGPLVANATEMPRAGATTFGLYLSGAPAQSQGLCMVATAPSSSGPNFGSARLWLNPTTIVRRIPLTTDDWGFVETPLPLGPGAVGQEFWAQFIIRNALDCTTGGRLVASNAVHITVQ